MKRDTIDDRVGKPDNISTHKQAEILFQYNIDPKYFVNINELSNSGSDDDLDIDDLPF